MKNSIYCELVVNISCVMMKELFMKVFVVLCLTSIAGVYGHGMLWDPPSRSSLWRFGYEAPVNYDDNQNFCGGFHGQMRGEVKCGICGDPYKDPTPRDNEHGGRYGLGIITRKYQSGAIIPITINLEAEHKGYFEFHICNMDKSKESEECFKILPFDNGSFRYFPHGSRFHNLRIQLPNDLYCKHCVLRWHYKTGNTWGYCEDGSEGLGCGPQETFRNCADILVK